MKSEPQYVAKTLAWCNERRKEQKRKPLKRLPKGRKADPFSCPCGKATGLRVLGDVWRETGEHPYQQCPAPVKRFIEAFDRGGLPQYDEAWA